MRQLECETCAPDIERFYDTSFEAVELTQRILDTAVKHGGRYLTPGRVVILRDGVRFFAMGILACSGQTFASSISNGTSACCSSKHSMPAVVKALR